MRVHDYGHEVAIMHEAEPSALCNRVSIRVHLCIKTRNHGYSVCCQPDEWLALLKLRDLLLQ